MWMPVQFGRKPYFKGTDGPVDDSINIISFNGAPLDNIAVLRGGKYVSGGPFSPGMKDDKGRLVDDIQYGFWVRTLYDTLGGFDGMWPDGSSSILLCSKAGGTYGVAHQ
jgi:hypothetical protein